MENDKHETAGEIKQNLTINKRKKQFIVSMCGSKPIQTSRRSQKQPITDISRTDGCHGQTDDRRISK